MNGTTIFMKIAALPVFKIFWNGSSAVVGFFILSGYYMTVGFEKRVHSIRDGVMFSLRRLARLYPPTWLAIGMSFLLHSIYFSYLRDLNWQLSSYISAFWKDPISLFDCVRYMRLILLRGKSLDLNPPLWTMSKEIHMAVTFPILLAILLSPAVKDKNRGVAVSLFATAAFFGLNIFTPKVALVYAFLAGCLLYYCLKNRTLTGIVEKRKEWFLFAGIIFQIIAVTGINEWLGSALILISWFQIIWVLNTGYQKESVSVKYLLLYRTGEISFELYLVHFPILLFLRPLAKDGDVIHEILFAAATLAGTVIMALLLKKIEDTKAMKWLTHDLLCRS